jgi:hypothetical protein
MFKLIDFFKYIFFICWWKAADLWKRTWRKKQNDGAEILNDLRSDIILINIDQYHSLFASPTRHPEIFMPRPVFDKIIHNLPPNYVLPELKTLRRIIEAYNKPVPVLHETGTIDNQVLDKIKASLPGNYILPLPVGERNKPLAEPVVLKAPISLVKTFAPTIFPDTRQPAVSEDLNTDVTPEAPVVAAPILPQPAASSKKIIKPVLQQSTPPVATHYKFIFLK